jgi:hypothetical protein
MIRESIHENFVESVESVGLGEAQLKFSMSFPLAGAHMIFGYFLGLTIYVNSN